jgi:hypothetical protein
VTDAPSIYQKCRTDVAGMLGYDLDNLSAEQSTRLDIGTALRVLLDNQSGRLLRGESLDARELLMASDALAKILPPLREPPAPVDNVDPRQIMWETYSGMRRRGELFDLASTFEGRGRRIAELEAEVAALKAAGAPAPGEPSVPPADAGARADNVVKLRDNPGRSCAASAAPEEEYEDVTVTEAVLGQPEAWRGFARDVDGMPVSGRGKYWGPVR